MSLPHGVREPPQTGKVLVHGAERCRARSLRIRVEVGLAEEFLVGLLQVLDERLLVSLRIVNEATEFIEALLPQTMEYDVNRRPLFAHEQDSFASRDVIGDQVRNRLRFTGSRWSLDNVTRAGARPGKRGGLGGIAVD